MPGRLIRVEECGTSAQPGQELVGTDFFTRDNSTSQVRTISAADTALQVPLLESATQASEEREPMHSASVLSPAEPERSGEGQRVAGNAIN